MEILSTSGILLKQMLQMLLYIGIGWILYRTSLITRQGSLALTHLLLYVILPCVIVNSFSIERNEETTRRILLSLLLGAAVLAVSMLIARLVFSKRPIDNFAASFSNAGFMGIPLIAGVLGGDSVRYIVGMVALLNVLQWTYGQVLLTGDKKKMSPRALITSPLIIAFLLGLLIFATQLKLPQIAASCVSAIAGCNAPVAMIVLGVFLGQTKLKEIFTDKAAYLCSAVRLLLIPGVTLLMLMLLPESLWPVSLPLLLAAAAPVGSNVAAYTQKLELDSCYASKTVCLSTILSVVTLPVIYAAAVWLRGL